MQQHDIRLPAAAVEALARGRLVEAIKIVRQASGAGLKDAKDLVETFARQQQGRPMPVSMSHDAPPRANAAGFVFPPEATAALARGEVILAVKAIRDANPGIDLRSAKDMVDGVRAGAPAAPGMSAGVSGIHVAAKVKRVPTVEDGDGDRPVWLLLGIVVAIAAAAWWALA